VKLLGQLVVLGLERDGDLPTDDLVDRSVIAQEKSGDMATITQLGNFRPSSRTLLLGGEASPLLPQSADS